MPTNPFWNGDPQALRSTVWAYGLRNPFRFTLGPSGVPIVGDVGWNTAEELSQARRGANLGWPCYEGAGRTPGYDEYERCQELYAGGTSAVEPPLVSIPHAEGASAIVAGDFLVGDGYDADLRGAYVFANFNTGRVQYVHLRAGRRASEVEELGTAEALVDVQRGTDGALYCLSLAGELWRIVPD